jgi:hypothetical protein
VDRESRPRIVFWVIAVLVSSGLGYLASGGGVDADGPVRFSFTSSNTSYDVAGIPDLEAGLGTFSRTCQWPDGRTSISLAEVRTFDCFPDGVGQFPVPNKNSIELLVSPIGGAKYPVQNGNLSDDIRVVHPPNSEGVIDVGPVLMQFGLYSGGAQPSFISDSTSLWIFDYVTENGPEVIRISTTTGALLQRTIMPAISRPVIGVDRYGFWMGQTSNSFYGQNLRLGIWLAPIGAKRGELLKSMTGIVWSIMPSGDSMIAYVSTGLPANSAKPQLWRFTPIS